jgi:protein AaeX
MFGEIDVLGAFMPRAVILFVIGLLIFAVADWCLTKMRFYKYFWHPPLARLALFVCLFCLGGWFASIH